MKRTLLLLCVGLLAIGCSNEDESVTNDPEKVPSKPSMTSGGASVTEPEFVGETPATQPAKK